VYCKHFFFSRPLLFSQGSSFKPQLSHFFKLTKFLSPFAQRRAMSVPPIIWLLDSSGPSRDSCSYTGRAVYSLFLFHALCFIFAARSGAPPGQRFASPLTPHQPPCKNELTQMKRIKRASGIFFPPFPLLSVLSTGV